MRNVQMEALLQTLGADGRSQHALFTVDGVDLGAGGVARAGHKFLVAGSQQQLFTVSGGLALGLGIVQEGLVSLAEVLRSGDGIGSSIRYSLVFIEQFFEFLSGFHLEFPFLLIYLRVALIALGDFLYILPHLWVWIPVQRDAV